MADRLDVYRSKRDFGKTPEPIHDVVESGQTLVYAIQKHAASRLHYDLRLEIDGVLLSWAMPKGPSFDPKQFGWPSVPQRPGLAACASFGSPDTSKSMMCSG